MCIPSLKFTSSPPFKRPFFAPPKIRPSFFRSWTKNSGAFFFAVQLSGRVHPIDPLQCRRLRCPAAVGADSVARPVRTTTVTRLAVARPFGEEKWGISLKRHGNPQKKCLLIIKPGPTACYVTITQLQKKSWCQVFFFRYVFGDFGPAWFFLLSISPKNPWFFQAPNAMRRSRKRRSMGWASKAPVGYCCLSPWPTPPWPTPGATQKWVDTLGVCFLSQISFFLQTSSKQKPKLWLQMMDLWEAKEGVQYNGSHPTTSKVYTDLRGFTWLLPLKASFVDAIQMKLDFQDFGTSQKYGSSFCSRRCMVNFLDDLSVIWS